jgi:hypothetical protein
MVDEVTRGLLNDIRRDIVDATEQIGQGVEEIEAGKATSSEALLGEAVARLKLLVQRIDEQLKRAD